MSNDRELLELAAKAAGIKVPQDDAWGGVSAERGVYRMNCDGTCFEFKWNPLTDDGDALRLVARLQMQVDYHARGHSNTGDVTAACGPRIHVCEPKTGDVAAATRRAIVRAAAEIGKAMP